MIYLVPNIPEPLSRSICADLIGSLPSPADDSPEERALRDERAITALAHYIPENAAEAEIAADIVAAEFHAKDALRGAARRATDDPATAERCRRQHALMMRTVHSGMRALLRMQAERQRLESALHPAAMVRAGYLHSGTFPQEPEPPPPQPAAAPEPQAPERPKYEDMTPAEQYAVIYPDRATAIRRNGGMPPGATFPPPGRRIVEDIATGDSLVFLDLDPKPPAGRATESATLSRTTVP
jgi:hypothetical protein